jgi:hypothetical protein
VQCLNEGNSETDKKYGAHKTKTHTSCKLQVFTTAILMMLTKIVEKGYVNMMSLCPKEERSTETAVSIK